MKVITCCINYNNVEVLPYFLRHYSSFCDEIIVWDDFSTDGSREILFAWPKVKVLDWPHPGSGIDENLFLDFARSEIKKLVGACDWVIWVDPDEFVYHPNILQVLESAIGKYGVIGTSGFNMTGDGFPKDNGKQIYEGNRMGIKSPVYSKPIIVNPACNVEWNRGKHAIVSADMECSPPLVKLLHYRFMGEAYSREKCLKNYSRHGFISGSKHDARTSSPEQDSPDVENTPLWAAKIQSESFDCIAAPLYERE